MNEPIIYQRHPYFYVDYKYGTFCIENTPANIAKVLYSFRNTDVVISSSWGVSLITMKNGYITSCRDQQYLYTRLYLYLSCVAAGGIPHEPIHFVKPENYLTENPLQWLRRYWRSLKGTNLTWKEKLHHIRYEFTRIEAPSSFFSNEEDIR